MGLFDKFRKRKDKPVVASADQSSLPTICYGIAYFVLPHYAYKDGDRLVAMFLETPESTGPFFYLMGCQVAKIEPLEEDGRRFRAHHGALDDAREYFVLEYPAPPPVDFSGIDPEKCRPEELPVLAPWFSAVVRQRETGVVSYFTLGQAPFGGGTTFRSVTADGMNCNHGPGPEPRFDDFLARLISGE